MLTETMLNDAQSIRDSLSRTVRDLELAIEREAIARRALNDAKQNYGDSEAEIKFELIHTADGKNAEQRAAAVDIGLIRSRADGALRGVWARLLSAQNEADAAKLALDQMTRRYRAIESAAEITTAMLRALSR